MNADNEIMQNYSFLSFDGISPPKKKYNNLTEKQIPPLWQGCSISSSPHGHALLCLDLIRASTERIYEGMFRTIILFHMSRDGLRPLPINLSSLNLRSPFISLLKPTTKIRKILKIHKHFLRQFCSPDIAFLDSCKVNLLLSLEIVTFVSIFAEEIEFMEMPWLLRASTPMGSMDSISLMIPQIFLPPW